MAKRISRFKKRVSDRSGFDYKEIQLIRDDGELVGPDEFDTPPPSKQPLGGEGDNSGGDTRSNSNFSSISTTDTPTALLNPTFYITAAGGITPSFSNPWMNVVGSNNAITISANPSIVSGAEGQILTLFGVGSSITLNNANGISLMGSSNIVIDSGVNITFMYNTANNVWNETSRGRI